MKNIFAQKESSYHNSHFNHFYYYYEKHQQFPSVFESRVPLKKSCIDLISNIDGIKEIYSHDLKYREKNQDDSFDIKEKDSERILEHLDCMVIITNQRLIYDYNHDDDEILRNDKIYYYVKILYHNKENLEKIKSLFEFHLEKQKNKVNLLCRVEHELTTESFEVNLPQKDFDLSLNYDKELIEKNTKLLGYLNKNKPGLALFSGLPGTGKSTYIKYIATQINRKIIYLSSSSIEELTSPDFLTFMMGQRRCVLLLEDAEKVLKSREVQDNPGISNILNLSDGILGDCLGVFIIATFNVDREQIDSALLRKGRLFLEHQFDKLSVDQCNLIFEKNNSSRRTNEPLSLAEIYNEEDNYSKKEEKRKVGF